MLKTYSFIADVHIGNHALFGGEVNSGVNARAARVLGALSAAIAECIKSHTTHLFILGDLFDVAKPTPGLLEATARTLQEFTNHTKSEKIILLRGNHDMVSESETILEVFACMPKIEVVTVTRVVDGVLCVPFTSRESMETEIKTACRIFAGDKPHTLVFHAGLADASTPPWLVGAADAIDVQTLAEALPATVHSVFAGNWHDRKEYVYKPISNPRVIVQVGALMPTGFDNAYHRQTGFVHHISLAADGMRAERGWARVNDTEFQTRTWGEDGYLESINGYVRFLVEPDELAAAKAAVALSGMKAHGVDYQIDRSGVRSEHKNAVRAAAGASGIGEAVAAFVQRMPLEAGVDRAAVLAAVRRFAKLGEA